MRPTCANQEVNKQKQEKVPELPPSLPDAHGDSPKPCFESFFRFTSVISRSGEDTTLHLLCTISIMGLQFTKKINTINRGIKITGLF